MRPDMDSYFAAEGITFRYFKKAKRNIVEHAALSADRGEVTVLIGNSGCGKSTFAGILCGLYPENGGCLEGGDIRIGRKSVMQLPYSERCREISMVFQNPDLSFCMANLRDELYFCLENISTQREKMSELIETFSETYGVHELLDRPFAQLSGGEKQKAALCCALILNPKVLILDEPFANIDPEGRGAFVRLLKEKAVHDGTVIIAIDHRSANWKDIADRYVLLGEGCSILDDIPKDQLALHRNRFEELGFHNPLEAPPEFHADKHTADQQPVIKLQDVSIAHHRGEEPQVSCAALTGYPGEMIACLGPSGAGKTTLFLSLLGRKPYTGSMLLDGREIKQSRSGELFAKIGIVFQNPANQFLSGTVLDEVMQGLSARRNLSAKEKAEEAERLLASFDLLQYARYSPYMLSQGQQRKLGVLIMISGEQKVLLLDEPTYGQDGKTTEAIMEYIKQKCAEGMTVIYTTHDLSVAYRYSSRIWKIKDGQAYEQD